MINSSSILPDILVIARDDVNETIVEFLYL